MSDNDLIRRGDAREMLQQCGLMGNHPEDPLATMFNEIPAVQPTVSPKQLAAQPDDVAALVDAFDKIEAAQRDTGQEFPTAAWLEFRAALARVKGETK